MAENWIVPCNTKQFDIIEHFKKNDKAIWKNSFTIRKGDNVYIYLSAPYGEIRYRCVVISDTVSEELLAENAYAIVKKPSNNFYSKKIKYIQIEKVQEYSEGTFPLEKLRDHGLGQVQIQARTDRKLQLYIDEIERNLSNGGDE